MRKLLPLLVVVLLTSACKEDKAPVTESNPISTPAKPNNTKPAVTINDKSVAVETPQPSKNKVEQVTSTADTKKPISDHKASTTVKVKQPTSSSNIKIAEPVVKTAAPAVVHNNSLSVTTHKAPETLADNYPFNVDLKTVDGKLVKSSEIFKKNGKPTVLLFWLSTCRPCHQKMEAIKPLYPEWKEDILVL